jgi:hypothetical protein
MSKRATSVPSVPRVKSKIVALKFPPRYDLRYPAPDEEPFDSVNQFEFAATYFKWVALLFVGMALFAAFVLVPLTGLIFAG